MSNNFIEQFNALPENLAHHLKITVVALAVGVMLSVPVAMLAVRRRRLRYPLLTVAGVIQTVPSLALLALMVPLLAYTNGLGMGLPAFGFYPAVIALTLYSMLPILRNTVTGILGVDPALTEAARGMGMTPRQVLWRVQLPLAAPVIIAGIRTAAVWVVGIATLATPVGQRSLGNYIFTGLQTRNWMMIMFGVVAAAALAIVLDLLIAAVQRGVEKHRQSLTLAASAALVLLLGVGLWSPHWVRASSRIAVVPVADADATDPAVTATGTVRIGAKTFTEQYILSQLIELALQEQGIDTRRTESLGSTIIFDALRQGDIDVYVDYTGTIWSNHMHRDDPAPDWQVRKLMTAWLIEHHGIRCLGPLGFENAYAIAMRREQAQALNIRSIDDLAEHAQTMKIAGDYEFFGRPEWQQIRDIYGLNFRETVSFDGTLMYEALAQGEVDVIAAFSSDGRIAAYDLVLLDDPRHVIPPYEAVVLLGPRAAMDERFVRTLRPLLRAVTLSRMQQANLMVDREEDKATVSQAAHWLWDQVRSSQ